MGLPDRGLRPSVTLPWELEGTRQPSISGGWPAMSSCGPCRISWNGSCSAGSSAAGELTLPPRWLVAAGPEVQVDPAALELELVDLALAVLLAAGLEGEHLQVAGEVLQAGQESSYGHATQRNGCPH